MRKRSSYPKLEEGTPTEAVHKRGQDISDLRKGRWRWGERKKTGERVGERERERERATEGERAGERQSRRERGREREREELEGEIQGARE